MNPVPREGGYLSYNGITIYLTKTNSVTAEPVLSQDNTEYLWTKYTINISGILNPSETSYANSPPVETPNTIPALTYNYIRNALSQPGKQLIFKNASTPIFNAPAQGLTTDTNGGPTPGRLIITRMDGGKTFHINFEITTYLNECPTGLNANILISNRYSQSHSINREHLTICTTRGIATFRSDSLERTGDVADTFRNQLLPLVPPGFQRVAADFRVNTKGNVIEYEITDLEKVYDLGDTGDTGSRTYITNIDGYYNTQTISGSNENGMSIPQGMSMATMNVKLWGSKRASTWVMTQLAFQFMSSSGLMPIGKPELGIVSHFSITQALTERYVELTLQMRIQADKNGKFGEIRTTFLETSDSKRFPSFNGINPDFPNDQGSRGTATLKLLSAALTEACSKPPDPLAATGQGGMGPPQYGGPPPAVSVQPTNTVAPSLNRYSEQQVTYPYAQAQSDSIYETNKGVYQAPVSGSSDNSNSSGDPPSTAPSPDLPSCSIINLHLPVSKRIVNWSVERWNKIPQVPAFESQNPNQVLMDYKINMAEVIVMPDGQTPCFRVTGRYVYAMKRDLSTFQAIAFDIPQWIDYPYGSLAMELPAQNTDEGGNFEQGIINGRFTGDIA